MRVQELKKGQMQLPLLGENGLDFGIKQDDIYKNILSAQGGKTDSLSAAPEGNLPLCQFGRELAFATTFGWPSHSARFCPLIARVTDPTITIEVSMHRADHHPGLVRQAWKDKKQRRKKGLFSVCCSGPPADDEHP